MLLLCYLKKIQFYLAANQLEKKHRLQSDFAGVIFIMKLDSFIL